MYEVKKGQTITITLGDFTLKFKAKQDFLIVQWSYSWAFSPMFFLVGSRTEEELHVYNATAKDLEHRGYIEIIGVSWDKDKNK